MKLLLTFGLALSLMACAAPEDTVPTARVNDSIEDLEDLPIVAQGTFSGLGPYTSRGDAEIIFNSVEATYSLIMSDFQSSNGPSLKVYLSKASSPSSIINLGSLKSTNGNLRYDFAASSVGPDFDFSHVLIWCDQAGVGFGRASISTP